MGLLVQEGDREAWTREEGEVEPRNTLAVLIRLPSPGSL